MSKVWQLIHLRHMQDQWQFGTDNAQKCNYTVGSNRMWAYYKVTVCGSSLCSQMFSRRWRTWGQCELCRWTAQSMQKSCNICMKNSFRSTDWHGKWLQFSMSSPLNHTIRSNIRFTQLCTTKMYMPVSNNAAASKVEYASLLKSKTFNLARFTTYDLKLKCVH